MLARRTVVALTVAALAACVPPASVHTFRYLAAPTEDLGHERTVLLFPVRESRPQVVLEGRSPAWIGDERLGYAVPRQVRTHDGRPVAEIVEDWIARDLDSAGFDVEVAATAKPAAASAMAEVMRGVGAERAVFVDVLELASRTFRNVDIHWNLAAEVYDPEGNVLATRELQGHTVREGSLVNPSATARDAVPLVFAELMRSLVRDDDEVMAALTGD